MVDAEVVSRRLLVLNDALLQLTSRATAIDAANLRSDPLLRAATERWLQIAIGACVDLAYHVIADRGWVPADTLAIGQRCRCLPTQRAWRRPSAVSVPPN